MKISTHITRLGTPFFFIMLIKSLSISDDFPNLRTFNSSGKNLTVKQVSFE